MALPKVSRKISFSLPDISKANSFLLLELFSDLENKEDILKSINILQNNNIIDQLESSC